MDEDDDFDTNDPEEQHALDHGHEEYGDYGGEEGEEKEDEKAVTTPAEVIDAIIDDEVTLYAVKATEARQADAEQGVRMDSRREALRIY